MMFLLIIVSYKCSRGIQTGCMNMVCCVLCVYFQHGSLDYVIVRATFVCPFISLTVIDAYMV